MQLLLQGSPGEAIDGLFVPLVPFLLIIWLVVVFSLVVRRVRRWKKKIPSVINDSNTITQPPIDAPIAATLNYQTATDGLSQRRDQITAELTRAFFIVAFTLLSIITAFGTALWYSDREDRQADQTVRQWMDGPRNDPVTSIRLSAPYRSGEMDATLIDPDSLAAVNAALPGALREFPNPHGEDVEVELHFKSGVILKTHGEVSPTVLTIQNPTGDRWDGYDIVTLQFPATAPSPLLAMLAFAEKSTGKKSF